MAAASASAIGAILDFIVFSFLSVLKIPRPRLD
jgi:hypothetical protein